MKELITAVKAKMAVVWADPVGQAIVVSASCGFVLGALLF